MFCMLKKKNISYPVLKHNSKREKEVIVLIISNREEWYYLTVKKYLHY